MVRKAFLFQNKVQIFKTSFSITPGRKAILLTIHKNHKQKEDRKLCIATPPPVAHAKPLVPIPVKEE